jgi:HK97 family phage major capsid protein
MSLLATVKTLRDERKQVCDAAGAIIAKAGKEKRPLTPEENQEWDRRHAKAEALEKRINQIIDLGADGRMAGREDFSGATDSYATEGQRNNRTGMTVEQRDATRRWLLSGAQGLNETEQRQYFRPVQQDEQRALSSSTGAAGAYTIPGGFVYSLEVATKYTGGIVDAAAYIDTDNGMQMPYPSINDTANSGEVISENTAATTTQDPTYGVVVFNAYMFDSGIIKVPVQLAQDSAFNVEDYLNEALGTRIGRKLNTKCTTGTGANEPTGVVTASTLGATTAGATAITYGEIVDLEYSVDVSYRAKASYMMNDSIVKLVRKLVDSNGRPLWIAGGVSEGIVNKRPDTLNGYPLFVNNDMDTIATTKKTMLFGDFSKYKIRRLRQLQLVRMQERFIDALQIGLLAFQRFDGNVVDAGTHPIKYLQQA